MRTDQTTVVALVAALLAAAWQSGVTQVRPKLDTTVFARAIQPGEVVRLAHLSAFSVAKGDRVQRGTIVGLVGATGRVTGPHLHWGIRLNKARVDPLSLLVATGAPPP